MAAERFENGSEEWLMFVEFWKICQMYWKVEENDKYWQELTEAIDEFYEKFKHIHLAKGLALSFVNSQEKKYAENRK